VIKINKITTKTGDSGMTLGPGLQQTLKCDLKIEFLGKLDELNTEIGDCLNYIEDNFEKTILNSIQHQIFDIGALYFKQEKKDLNNLIKFLEEAVEKINDNKELTSFLIPGGSKKISQLNKARCKTREAERVFWKNEVIESGIGIYLNRLSDLIFTIIKKDTVKEENSLWKPNFYSENLNL